MTLQEAIDQAQAIYLELDEALNKHDWREIGRVMYRLKRALDAIQAAAGPGHKSSG